MSTQDTPASGEGKPLAVAAEDVKASEVNHVDRPQSPKLHEAMGELQRLEHKLSDEDAFVRALFQYATLITEFGSLDGERREYVKRCVRSMQEDLADSSPRRLEFGKIVSAVLATGAP
jgi:hypothetical protein